MTWRSNISGADRFFGCLPYLLPLIEIAGALTIISMLIPGIAPLQAFLALLAPVLQIYAVVTKLVPLGLGSFVIFLLMFLAVVQNEKINYSVRFNTLQAILFSIVLSLWNLVAGLFVGEFQLVLMLIMPVVILGACLYSITMTALGKYPDIPKISENIYMMLPR
jgi:uncharacterized membrane protein YcfT